jgi:hypothetical protein
VLLVATSIAMESTSIVVLVPSFAPPILTILNLVLDIILTREGGTKGGRTKFRKAWA